MEALSFPLYHGFFPQLVLSVDELVAYRRLGKERVSQLVRIVEDADCVYTWSDVKRDGSSSSSKNHAAAKCQRATFVDVRPDSKAALPCTLLKASVHIVDVHPDEVLAALAKSRTKELRKTMAYMHGESFVDAQTLLTFPTSATSKKPAYSYRAIKWCALRSKRRAGDTSATAAAAKRKGSQAPPSMLDFCYLEYAGRKKAHPGSTVLGFIVQESLSAEREVPRLEGFGIARAPLTRSGVIISRTHQSNILKVTAICQIDGALPASLRTAMESILLERVASIQRVKGLLERQRMGKLQYLEEWEWVATSDRKACAVCLRGFYFHRKHHCQTCGEVVCSSCAPLRELEEPLFDITQLRVCTVCLASAGSQAAASTERTSSNDATEAYMRELQHPPKHAAAAPRASLHDPITSSAMTRHRPVRLSDDHNDGVSRLRTSELSFGGAGRGGAAGRPSTTTPATTEALSKLAYHMQQIRETINVAVSEVDQSNSQSCDDVYEKILQIRETLDISSSEFDAVLAAIGGGGSGASHSDAGGDSDGSFRYSSSNDTGSELNVSYSYSSNSDGYDGDGGRSSLSRDGDVDDDDSLLYADSRRSSSSLSRYSSLQRLSQPRSSYPRSSMPWSSQWRSSLSQSSRDSGSSDASMSRDVRSMSYATHAEARDSERYYYHSNVSSSSPSVHDRRSSPAHKDSLFSDQTVASSASKQSSDGKQRRHLVSAPEHLEHQHAHHHHEHLEHVMKLNSSRGIHRLAQKIEKLQQRLEDSRRAASVVSSSDFESEPEPEAFASTVGGAVGIVSGQSARTRRTSFVESTPSRESPARQMSSPHVPSEMVQALRGVMESRELTQAPPAWRKSFSSARTNSHDASSSASSSSRLSASSSLAGRRGARSRMSGTSGGVLVGLPPSGSSTSSRQLEEPTTIFVYDEDSVNKFQRLSIEKRAAPSSGDTATTVALDDEERGVGREERREHTGVTRDDSQDDDDDFEDDDGQDEEFSISSSSEDGHVFAAASMRGSSLARGRDRDGVGGRLHLYPPASPSSLSLGASDSLEEGDDNVASLLPLPSQELQKQLYGGGGADETESNDATRRLLEDVSKLPARMRTSSGQSSGAPSQENHDF